MGHIILATSDSIYFVDNLQRVYVDRKTGELVLDGGGRSNYLTVKEPLELLELIRCAAEHDGTTVIEVPDDD